MRGGPVRLVKGPVVIVDDTVTARLREDVSPENSWTAVIRFCLDYRAIFKGKSHNRCAVSKFFIHSVYFKLGYLPCWAIQGSIAISICFYRMKMT